MPVSTFGPAHIVRGGIAVVRPLGADRLIVGPSVSLSGNGFSPLVYSVADPPAPTLVSNRRIERSFLQDLIVSGTTVPVPLGGVFVG